MFCDFQLITGGGALSVCHCVAFIAYKHNASRTDSVSGRGFRSAVSPVVTSFRSSFRCAVGLYRTRQTAQQFFLAFSRLLCSFSLPSSFFPFCFPLSRSGVLRRFLFFGVLSCFTILYQNGMHNACARVRDLNKYKKSAGGFTPSARSSLFVSGSVCNIESGGVIVAVAVRLVAR